MSMKRLAMSVCLTDLVITPVIADFIIYPNGFSVPTPLRSWQGLWA